jgi:hypothetical protein
LSNGERSHFDRSTTFPNFRSTSIESPQTVAKRITPSFVNARNQIDVIGGMDFRVDDTPWDRMNRRHSQRSESNASTPINTGDRQ